MEISVPPSEADKTHARCQEILNDCLLKRDDLLNQLLLVEIRINTVRNTLGLKPLEAMSPASSDEHRARLLTGTAVHPGSSSTEAENLQSEVEKPLKAVSKGPRPIGPISYGEALIQMLRDPKYKGTGTTKQLRSYIEEKSIPIKSRATGETLQALIYSGLNSQKMSRSCRQLVKKVAPATWALKS